MLQKALENSLRQTLKNLVRPTLHPSVPIRVQRALIRQAYLASMPPSGCWFEHTTAGGIPVTRTQCQHSDPGRILLYLHGGAYIIGSPDTHRGLTGHLALASGTTVIAPDYRLAPENPFPAGLDDAYEVYRALLDDGHDPARIAFAGDSAGGGLALSLALKLKNEGLPLPGSMTVFSPWTDLSNSRLHHPVTEPLLQERWINKAATLYCGPESRTNPLISPVFGDLRGLPPLLIQVGSEEILLNDAERLASAARKAGVEVTLEIFNSLWHVFQIHAGQLDRATRALDEAGTFIRQHSQVR